MTVLYRGSNRQVIGYRIINGKCYRQINIGAGMTHYVAPVKAWPIPQVSKPQPRYMLRGDMRLEAA